LKNRLVWVNKFNGNATTAITSQPPLLPRAATLCIIDKPS
jgi:hypothetical protein